MKILPVCSFDSNILALSRDYKSAYFTEMLTVDENWGKRKGSPKSRVSSEGNQFVSKVTLQWETYRKVNLFWIFLTSILSWTPLAFIKTSFLCRNCQQTIQYNQYSSGMFLSDLYIKLTAKQCNFWSFIFILMLLLFFGFYYYYYCVYSYWWIWGFWWA